MLDLTWISWILPHFGAGFDLDLWDFPYFRAGSTSFSLLLLPHQFHPSPPQAAGAQLGAGGVELGRAAVRGKGLGPVWPRGRDWEGKLVPVHPSAPVKMAAPMRNMATPIGERAPSSAPGAGLAGGSREEPKCSGKNRVGRAGERSGEIRRGSRKEPKCSGKSRGTEIGSFRSASLRLLFRKNPKCSGKCRSGVEAPERVDLLPEEAEAPLGPPEPFQKVLRGPALLLPETPEAPPPSGDPRSDSGNSGSGSKAAPANPEAVPQPPETVPKQFRKLPGGSGVCREVPKPSGGSRSDSRDPRSGPGDCPAFLKRFRRVLNHLPLSGDLRSGSGRFRAAPDIPKTVPQSPETVPKRFRRSPRRFRKLPSDSGNSRSGSEAIPELPEVVPEIPEPSPEFHEVVPEVAERL